MANIIVLSPRDSDAATLTASSEVETLPVSNLQTMQPRRVWRSTDTDASITFTFTGTIAPNILAMNGVNFSPVTVWRVIGADTIPNLTAAPLYQSGWRSVWPPLGKPTSPNWPNYLCAMVFDNSNECQYWRVDIDDPSVGQTYLEAGRVMLGRRWQPDINFDWGSSIGYDQRDVQVVTDYGNTFTDRRQKSATRVFTLQMTAAEERDIMDGIAEIQRLRGTWGDVVVLLNPDATTDFHRLSMQGVFTAQQEHQAVPWFDDNDVSMWTAKFPLREII